MNAERVSVSRQGLAALLEAVREVWGDVDYLDGADDAESAAELEALIVGLERGDVLDEFHKALIGRLAPCPMCGSTQWDHSCRRDRLRAMRGMADAVRDAKKAPG